MYGIYIFGGIDGKPRAITFMNCSDNMRAPTLLQEFVNAVYDYCIPQKVRSDHGMENFEISKLMLYSQKEYKTGSSVNNQSIERL